MCPNDKEQQQQNKKLKTPHTHQKTTATHTHTTQQNILWSKLPLLPTKSVNTIQRITIHKDHSDLYFKQQKVCKLLSAVYSFHSSKDHLRSLFCNIPTTRTKWKWEKLSNDYKGGLIRTKKKETVNNSKYSSLSTVKPPVTQHITRDKPMT